MKKIIALTLLLALPVIPASAQTDREKFVFYNNCKPFGLSVYLIKSSLKRETLNNVIESKLLSARIPYYMKPTSKNTDEDLAVSVICGIHPSSCSANVTFIKHGVTSYGISSWVFTWDKKKIVATTRNSILSAISESIDEFIVGYLKANKNNCR